jgi:hypothetical protein
MRHDDADVAHLHDDIESLNAIIAANLEDRRGSFALQAAFDVLRERVERLAELEDAA